MDKIHKSFCANSVNFFTKCFYYMSQNDLRFVDSYLHVVDTTIQIAHVMIQSICWNIILPKREISGPLTGIRQRTRR